MNIKALLFRIDEFKTLFLRKGELEKGLLY